jgi:hypothetical protein
MIQPTGTPYAVQRIAIGRPKSARGIFESGRSIFG